MKIAIKLRSHLFPYTTQKDSITRANTLRFVRELNSSKTKWENRLSAHSNYIVSKDYVFFNFVTDNVTMCDIFLKTWSWDGNNNRHAWLVIWSASFDHHDRVHSLFVSSTWPIDENRVLSIIILSVQNTTKQNHSFLRDTAYD